MERAGLVRILLPWGFVLVVMLVVFPARSANAVTRPIWTVSRYMQTADTTTLYNEGCSLGTHDKNTSGTQHDVVVLDFGSPVRFSDGSYGATLFGGPNSRTPTIAAAVEQFARGYYLCTGSDTSSYLIVAAGTSNYGSYVTNGHGQAWANMVDSINSWILNLGYSSQTEARGASDMELDWNSPSVTEAWANGFDSVSTVLYYDYGDAAGCNSTGRAAGAECGTTNQPDWTAYDVWYISYGVRPALPLPEIYRNDGANAYQWKGLSLYAYLNQGGRMNIQGSFTQHQACLDRGCDSSLDNTPNQGWTQLYNALNSDSRTAQSVRYSTDITWKN